MPKAGSSICDLILLDFYAEAGFDIDRIAERSQESSKSEPDFFKEYQGKMKLEGVYYGVARGIYVRDMPILDNMRLVVQVRDPRDCLVSAYFSYAKSHKIPVDPAKRAAFEEMRSKTAEKSIDEYVLGYAHSYRDRMRLLRQFVDRGEGVLFLRYEEMVLETDAWLSKIIEFSGQPMTDSLKERLGNKIDFTVDHEDPEKHKRQVIPGDHARKLKPETVTEINEILRDEMQYFGYSV